MNDTTSPADATEQERLLEIARVIFGHAFIGMARTFDIDELLRFGREVAKSTPPAPPAPAKQVTYYLHVYKSVNGQYYWRATTRKGRNVATGGEGFTRKRSAELAGQRLVAAKLVFVKEGAQ